MVLLYYHCVSMVVCTGKHTDHSLISSAIYIYAFIFMGFLQIFVHIYIQIVYQQLLNLICLFGSLCTASVLVFKFGGIYLCVRWLSAHSSAAAAAADGVCGVCAKSKQRKNNEPTITWATFLVMYTFIYTNQTQYAQGAKEDAQIYRSGTRTWTKVIYERILIGATMQQVLC